MPMQLKIKSWLGKILSKAFYGEAQISLCLWDDPASLVAQKVKRLPTMQEIRVQSPGGSPREGNGNPLQYSCVENPMDREAW